MSPFCVLYLAITTFLQTGLSTMDFHLSSGPFDDSSISSDLIVNPLTAVDSASDIIYIFGPETRDNTKYKSFTDKLNINDITIKETKTTNFLSFPDSPISTGYCQFDNYLYYMSSTNTINKLDISNPYGISSKSKWYISYLSDQEWITMTCDTENKHIYILQNDHLIIFSLSSDQTEHEIAHYQLDIPLTDSHSSIYYENKLYIIYGTSLQKKIGIIDIKDNYQWIDSNVTLQDCFDHGLNTFARNGQIYLLCHDYIKIYHINQDEIEITANKLNIPRYHASIQLYDIDDDLFEVFVFGGKSEINGSLPFEYTRNDVYKIDDEIHDNSNSGRNGIGHGHADEVSMDDDQVPASFTPTHLCIVLGLAMLIFCLLIGNAIKGRIGRGPSLDANSKVIKIIKQEGFVMRVPSYDDEVNDGMIDIAVADESVAEGASKYAKLSYPVNDIEDEGVADVMIDVVSE